MKVKYFIITLLAVSFACTKKKAIVVSDKSFSENGFYYFRLSKLEKYTDEQRINFLNKAFNNTAKFKNNKENRNLLADIVFQYYDFELSEGFNESSKVDRKSVV